jgi:hypothetical protein
MKALQMSDDVKNLCNTIISSFRTQRVSAIKKNKVDKPQNLWFTQK